MKQKIIPHLWFNNEAKEAADFYTTIFPHSKVTSIQTIRDTPSGDSALVSFQLAGYNFMAINGGPYFQFNPSISFFVHFNPVKDEYASQKLEKTWEQLSQDGEVLMPLQAYPFSERYGWVKDRYGLTWQLILSTTYEESPFIVPSFLFVQDVAGKAEEATDFYLSVFDHSSRESLSQYPGGSEANQAGMVMYTDFNLENQVFTAMDSALEHDFTFNEAISLLVRCENQEEIDYYWEKLSAVPEAEQCGWLKDQYGVSWQISPIAMEEVMENATEEQMARVTKAFLQMKKFDIATLEKAYHGE